MTNGCSASNEEAIQVSVTILVKDVAKARRVRWEGIFCQRSRRERRFEVERTTICRGGDKVWFEWQLNTASRYIQLCASNHTFRMTGEWSNHRPLQYTTCRSSNIQDKYAFQIDAEISTSSYRANFQPRKDKRKRKEELRLNYHSSLASWRKSRCRIQSTHGMGKGKRTRHMAAALRCLWSEEQSFTCNSCNEQGWVFIGVKESLKKT